MPFKPLPQHTTVSVTDTLITKEWVRKAPLRPHAADMASLSTGEKEYREVLV